MTRLRHPSLLPTLVVILAFPFCRACVDGLKALSPAPEPTATRQNEALREGKDTMEHQAPVVVASARPSPGPVARHGSSTHPTDQFPTLRVMSLNIYGWATMPDAAPQYAALVAAREIDVLGIQEGNWDWEIEGWPTDYSRSEQLHAALGECWERTYQIFVNTCRGAALESHRRFDLTDGPRAVRTGETALISKSGTRITFINIHWDHESAPARAASALETAAEANLHGDTPTIILGDFNCDCTSTDVSTVRSRSGMDLVVDGGIDCILARNVVGSGEAIEASPSDHPAVVATFEIAN